MVGTKTEIFGIYDLKRPVQVFMKSDMICSNICNMI